jgi:hypothetical protein
MPRLTNDRYIKRHLLLRQLWLKHQARYALLKPTQQWDVHDYYRPSEELTRAELLEHRRRVSRERPALPQRASKAFKILIGAAPAAPPADTIINAGPRGDRRIRVRAIVRPQIDVEKLASALLMLAELQAREQQKRKRRSNKS